MPQSLIYLKQKIHLTIFDRSYSTGDHLVAKKIGNDQLFEFNSTEFTSGEVDYETTEPDHTPRDRTLTVTYPRTGVGALITCVRIQIAQVYFNILI